MCSTSNEVLKDDVCRSYSEAAVGNCACQFTTGNEAWGERRVFGVEMKIRKEPHFGNNGIQADCVTTTCAVK